MESSPYRYYPLPEGADAVGAMAGLGDGRALLIERDSAGGEQAAHKPLLAECKAESTLS